MTKFCFQLACKIGQSIMEVRNPAFNIHANKRTWRANPRRDQLYYPEGSYANRVLITQLLLSEAWTVREKNCTGSRRTGAGAGADYRRVATHIIFISISLCQATFWVESHVILPYFHGLHPERSIFSFIDVPLS